MGSFSLIHWVIIALIVVLLFGAGRLSNVMGEFAKGIKAFRAGMREDDPPPTSPPQNPLYHAPVPPPVTHQADPSPVQQPSESQRVR